MSEETKKFVSPRPIQEIQNEYSQLCMKAGQLYYQITTFQKDLELLNGTLRDLNFEAAASQRASAEAAEKAEAEKVAAAAKTATKLEVVEKKANG